jgi:alcohol dehydrogenase (cytochrome c)
VKKGLALIVGIALFATRTFAQKPFERIVAADNDPGNWLTYSRTLNGQRYSPLKEINLKNAKNLKVLWAYQFPDAGNETSPLVLDGVIFLTGPNSATALDARTGRTIWIWKRPLSKDFRSVGFGHVNRGPAMLGDQLFVTTLDDYLVALDLKSGAERWVTRVADYKLGYSMTGAPLAIDGKVVTGVSGGEAGVRGFIDAYDARTGKLVWRFWTIPGPQDPAAVTWAGGSAEHGGGPAWVTGSYDPDLRLIYWGVGNPSPDWNGDARAGDNLYTDSFVALDSDSGKMRWHFQFTPHDTHDWDAAHVPVLFNAKIDGRERKLVVNANRNGFYYVLDRVTGEFLAGQAYGKQNWAKGLDAKGRPILMPNMEPTYEGTLVWPNANGSTIWFSPSYSPRTQLIYVPVRNKGAVYYKRDTNYKPGAFYLGGGEDELSPLDSSGEIRAMDATTGNLKWRFPLLSPASAGILSTAGGVVFSGAAEGNFFALDAISGNPLWDFQTGGYVNSNPITFTVDGHQRVAITVDRVLYAFGL